ncbi:MAG: response regulator [Ghiorsea sp.]
MKKILVVDDNLDNMDLIVEILEDEYYLPISFGEAEPALDYLDDHHVDLVLMDVSLPNMNGLEATKIIKTKFHHLPVFILSAHAMSADIEAGRAAGCDDYITKPIDEDSLLKKIATALNK